MPDPASERICTPTTKAPRALRPDRGQIAVGVASAAFDEELEPPPSSNGPPALRPEELKKALAKLI